MFVDYLESQVDGAESEIVGDPLDGCVLNSQIPTPYSEGTTMNLAVDQCAYKFLI